MNLYYSKFTWHPFTCIIFVSLVPFFPKEVYLCNRRRKKIGEKGYNISNMLQMLGDIWQSTIYSHIR